MGDQSLAELIRRRRTALGLSQARLGELVGRSASTIRNWERGESTPAARADAVALAAVLGLDERETLAGAGFEVADEPDAVTIEQAYASLGPERWPDPSPTVEDASNAGDEEAPEWEPPSPPPRRAAPPTVLAPVTRGEPSYLEDEEERLHYRARAVATAAAILFLLIVLMWSLNRATDALAVMWEEFVAMLEL